MIILSREREFHAGAGFTLIELLVVIVIIGILASIAIPSLNGARVRARETETAANLKEIQLALESFATDHGGQYPFRIRWFDNATINDPEFDPYEATDTGSGMHSDASTRFSLGLIGGVRTITDAGRDNTTDMPPDPLSGFVGIDEHKVIQPWGYTFANFYNRFNQYTDPLVAMGYMGGYPQNPFLKRPMGSIQWYYGYSDWQTGGNTLDKNVPGADVLATPGDFVYTFFYRVGPNNTLLEPEGVVEAKTSYEGKGPMTGDGVYYLDLIDSYHLWAYGDLRFRGGMYVVYPNNSSGAVPPGSAGAKKDWDNSGIKDMYELGMIAYHKKTGSFASQARDSEGNRVEF